MKKLSILAAAAATLLVACGPSKAELEAAEKAKQDSLAAVAKADSIAAAEKMAAEEAAKADSLAKAEEEAKLKAEEEAAAHHSGKHETKKNDTKPGQIDITKKPGAGETKIDITKKPGASH